MFVLGLLNSRPVDFYLRNISTNFRGGWFGYDAKVIRRLPIQLPDMHVARHQELHTRISESVQQMLQLNESLLTARTPNDTTRLQRQIDATDRQIDRLVYELYGLSEDEIRLVEDATG